MSDKNKAEDTQTRPRGRPWVRPRITYRGSLTELVQGGGKTGGSIDAEGTRKRGGG